MNKIVCIDSHIAVWGIKGQGNISDIERTRLFFEQLDQNKIEVLVPTVVIAEILVKEMPQKHPALIKVIQDNFIVGDFHIGVAQAYGDLVGRKINEGKAIRKSSGIGNDEMKFDYAVISTAIFYGASCIYTYDDGLEKFAKGVIDIRKIPDIYIQTTFDFSGS